MRVRFTVNQSRSALSCGPHYPLVRNVAAPPKRGSVVLMAQRASRWSSAALKESLNA